MLFGVAKIIDFFKEKEVKYEIEKTFVVSTAHVSGTDIQAIGDEDHFPYPTVSTGYGFLIYIGSEDRELESLENPDSFKKIIKKARKLGCTWVKLDRDGPQYPTFTTYDW